MNRPTWPQHWMAAAHLAAEMSTCAGGRKVGAVVVKGNRQLTSGFNGVPASAPHPTICLRRLESIPSGHDPHRCGCQHAEANAISHAAKHGISLDGGTLYATCQPCRGCMGQLINAGIKRVIFEGDYPDDAARVFAEHAEVELIQIDSLSLAGFGGELPCRG